MNVNCEVLPRRPDMAMALASSPWGGRQSRRVKVGEIEKGSEEEIMDGMEGKRERGGEGGEGSAARGREEGSGGISTSRTGKKY